MAIVYEQDLSWIAIGQTVSVTTPSLPGKSFVGKITFIDPTLDEATRSARVRVEIPNPLVNGHRELLNKLYADGVVNIEIPPVLSVPRTAVIQTGPQAVVYTDQGGGAYQQVRVRTGRRGETLIEILAGLALGDRVVTGGNLLIDGQAELNRAFTTAPEEPEPEPDGVIAAEQAKAITAFLTTIDAMSAALAADDLTAFNQASEPAMTVATDLSAALARMDLPPEKIEELDAARHFHGSDTIAQARSRFLRFSMAVTDLLGPLRTMQNFPDMQIWQCPMVNQAIPDAAAKGRWIQTGNRPIRNPYFGAEMLECGDQIKP
jgi:Cu(I)/Ag(I) efflux system membrane fusion protein